MTGAAASDGWAAFTRRGLTLWLPASVNLGIASLLAPAMNALLARADDPEASIAGFSVALGVITIVALPQFRIQQLTLVFLHDHRALRSLRRFVVITAAAVGAISCAAALTPAGRADPRRHLRRPGQPADPGASGLGGAVSAAGVHGGAHASPRRGAATWASATGLAGNRARRRGARSPSPPGSSRRACRERLRPAWAPRWPPGWRLSC